MENAAAERSRRRKYPDGDLHNIDMVPSGSYTAIAVAK